MPDAPVPRKPTRAERQRQRREEQRRREREQAVAEAARRELADEQLAPAVRRHAIVDAAGDIYRVPTVRRDGVTFVRSAAISYLVSANVLTFEHEKAAERLSRAWEDGGRGIGTAAGGYDERVGGVPQTGWISDQVLAAIGYQSRCKTEYAAAIAWMGALYLVVQRVVLEGIQINAWAKETHQDRRNAAGYLHAAMDRLVEFYAAVDKRADQPAAVSVVRSVSVVSPIVREFL